MPELGTPLDPAYVIARHVGLARECRLREFLRRVSDAWRMVAA